MINPSTCQKLQQVERGTDIIAKIIKKETTVNKTYRLCDEEGKQANITVTH